MKYGILTYHNIPNFGALLQGYALCRAMRDLGADCEIIDYRCENIVKRELTFHKSRNPLKSLVLRLTVWPETQKKISACQRFGQRYYSAQTYTRETIPRANLVYDGFIAGSDMIWNREVNGYDDTFFLDFTEEAKRRFSYASSIGSTWKETDLPTVSRLLRRFDRLSVREEDTANFIRKEFGLPCENVSDPTVLLPPTVWDELTTPVREKNYVLVYFPYQDILEAAKRYAQEHQKKLLVVGLGLRKKGAPQKKIYAPEQWLSYIKNADAVFTDSYHGLLFSLYFRRPVWTSNSGNRIVSLLRHLGQEDCWITRDPHFTHSIDYDSVTRAMTDLRLKSLDYLKKALEDGGKERAR